MTRIPTRRREPHPLTSALRACAAPLVGVALFSGVVNLLMLTSSLFMLQVYDMVLPGRSLPTLAVLLALTVMLYIFQALFDILRGRILVRLGTRIDTQLRGPVFATISASGLGAMPADFGAGAARDLDQIRHFASGQGPVALLDLPWMPLYLAVAFLFHPWLGIVTLGGIVLLCVTALLTEWLTQAPLQATAVSTARRNTIGEACRRNVGVMIAMGMQPALETRWQAAHDQSVGDTRRAGDVSGALGTLARALRFLLQSLVLAVGALLVIRQELTAGAMFACSMVAARALAPIELAVTHWRGVVAGRQSWRRLKARLADRPVPAAMMLPLPNSSLSVESLAVVPPGAVWPTLSHAHFTLKAGDGLGIIGPSACGKSTLVRALAGIWRPSRGAVRLDGATSDQWRAETLGPAIGYLPQDIELFEGTIAENIGRFSPKSDDAAVIAAARQAGIHEMIVRMPLGYETPLGEGGARLSGGQRQRIALARALYGEPFLLILDEPNSNLDSGGEAALIRAIAQVRARGGIVVLVAHRASVLAGVNLVLSLNEGCQHAFGPRDEVMRRIIHPAAVAGNVTELPLVKSHGEAHA